MPRHGVSIQIERVVAAPGDVTEVVVDVARRLRKSITDSAAETLTVVVHVSGSEPWCSAATAAVQGLVQCAALDLAPEGRRCNLVIAGAAVDTAAAVDYLAADSGAGATAIGMTIDLRPR